MYGYGELLHFGSRDGVDFTEAIAQNAGILRAISPQPAIQGLGLCRGVIRTLQIWSSANLSWETHFYGTHFGPTADPNSDSWLGHWLFATTDAVQLPGSPLWYYFIPSLEIPVINTDPDASLRGKLWVLLVNRSATAKGQYSTGSHFKFQAGITLIGG